MVVVEGGRSRRQMVAVEGGCRRLTEPATMSHTSLFFVESSRMLRSSAPPRATTAMHSALSAGSAWRTRPQVDAGDAEWQGWHTGVEEERQLLPAWQRGKVNRGEQGEVLLKARIRRHASVIDGRDARDGANLLVGCGVRLEQRRPGAVVERRP